MDKKLTILKTLKELRKILMETGYFVSEEEWNKKPRKNCLGRMLGKDLWIK